MLMEYLALAYPGLPWHTNIRVGPIEPHVPREGLSDAARKLMGSWRRYADAVVVAPHQLVVVEATIIKAVQKVGQLMEYVRLVPVTPELAAFSHLPLVGLLVSAIPDPRAQALCAEVGLHFAVYEPAWLGDFVDQYGRRFRRAPLSDVGQTFVG